MNTALARQEAERQQRALQKRLVARVISKRQLGLRLTTEEAQALQAWKG